MATPVHSTKTTGSRGELKAQVIFADIGWAPPVKLSEDIGTDLVTFARDNAAPEEKENAWDLGAPVFIQVKGSESEYLKPTNKRNGEQGWWFDESDTYHFDHWLSFGLPYLLVLVDTKNQIGYWAEVTGDAIVPTGKGRKIFVPAGQKIDETNLDALTKIAISRRRYALEGAVWNGTLNDLAPADRLRNALILPRLVAPHANRTIDKVSFEEAVAMVMRNRFVELVHRANEGKCPKVEDWESHKEWSWRFVHALRELVSTGGGDRFEQLAADARHRFERDACLVLRACTAYASGHAQDAVDVLKPSSATKPADRGWLLVQRAAFLLELDKPAEAATIAKKALVATKALDGDLSVSAIRGAAASILYTVAGFAAGDLAGTITAQDHAGNWWRAQDVSWALEKDLTLRFEGWTSNNTTHFINSSAGDDLTTVAWNAAFSAAWNAWRHLTAMTAQITFTSTTDPVRLAAALDALIFIGEKKASKDATRKIWLDGPVDPLQSLVNAIAYRPWTKRDEGPAMAVLSQAGDLLDVKAADHVVQRILDLLKTDGPVRVHGSTWSYRWPEAGDTLARVLKGASTRSKRKVADLITTDFATCDDSIAHAYICVAHALGATDLGATRVNKLIKAAIKRPDHYAIDLLGAIAPVSPEAVAELRTRADAGDGRAVRALLVAGSTDRDDFLALGKSATTTVRTMVADARGNDGTIKMSGHVNDQLDDLTLAALNTDDRKLWKEVTDALEACVIEETQQQRAIRRLAARFKTLPPYVQRKLNRLAPTLHGRSFGIALGRTNEFAAAVTQLRIATGTVPDLEVEAQLLSERRADPVGFARTLAAWNSERKLPFLATMVVDDNPAVRAQAGFSMIEYAHNYPDDRDRAFALIRSALMQEKGCALLDGLAQGLTAYPAKELATLEDTLRSHRSAVIRERFV
ncbi:DUF4365 domain-containing protein [Kribbella jiaozuonensis]|uniref:DUF4365 domain-containing protein n=1 Tax=Kribbella jiaozuonensis TaxID=2575441 RepID=A0A4U3M2B4_9ACTN|nr:DUF4365 domain-containing protein [Kribbella jiaozuonensis]TKK81386.1 DUF4365 domain-containing protein [Kribbella jiaozuonensis]